MHVYVPLTDLSQDLPDPTKFRFEGPLDVVRYLERDPLHVRNAWPDVWHLDTDGNFCCATRASSCDDLAGFAENPYVLQRSREDGLAAGGCPNRWLIIEPPFTRRKLGCDESDAAAFVAVKQHLARMGVVLVDALLFDESCRWFSMTELTTGSLTWTTADQPSM